MKQGNEAYKKRVRVAMTPVSVFLFLFLVSFFSFDSHAVVKGSETVVSVEAAATFPAIDSDNTMLGFGWFKNGFSFFCMT